MHSMQDLFLFEKYKNDIVQSVEFIVNHYSVLSENVLDTSDLDVAIERMAAAKKALGIVNKLQPGDFRAKHASRVLSNLNKIRGLVRRLEQKIMSEM